MRRSGASGWERDESVGRFLGVDGGVVALLCVGGVVPGGWLDGADGGTGFALRGSVGGGVVGVSRGMRCRECWCGGIAESVQP